MGCNLDFSSLPHPQTYTRGHHCHPGWTQDAAIKAIMRELPPEEYLTDTTACLTEPAFGGDN